MFLQSNTIILNIVLVLLETEFLNQSVPKQTDWVKWILFFDKLMDNKGHNRQYFLKASYF